MPKEQLFCDIFLAFPPNLLSFKLGLLSTTLCLKFSERPFCFAP